MAAVPASRRLIVVLTATGLAVTGLAVGAAAAISTPSASPNVPIGPIDVPTDLPTSGASATPTATASATASATPTATATATTSATPTSTASSAPTFDADGLFAQPRANCLQFADDAGDAAGTPLGGNGIDPDDDLDITGVVYKTGLSQLYVYVKETALGTAPSSPSDSALYDTHTFTTGFTVGGKVIVFSADVSGPAAVTVGGTASTVLHATAAFDTTHSNVVFTVPRGDLATLVGHSVAGAAVTGLTATSAASASAGLPPSVGDADDAAPTTTAQQTYTLGDNTCFTPPPGTLAISGLSATYSDPANVTATLKSASNQVVPNVDLTLSFPGLPTATAKTNASGTATFAFKTAVKAGTLNGTVGFAGNTAVGPTKASAPFHVYLESTVLRVVPSSGAVLAGLYDNDKTPLGGRTITFTYGSKVIHVAANANGQALLKGLPKGTSVKVSFAGLTGYYSAATSVTAKAL